VSGATPQTSVPEYWDGDICWATPKDLSDLDGHFIASTPRKITKAGLSSCAATMLPANSVLFSSRAPIGHVAVNTTPMATNQGFKSFIPRRDLLEPKFLYHWLRAKRAYLESLGNGATFKEVSKAVVARVEIALPPLPEQRRIAAILDQADALRAKRQEALAQLGKLMGSIFIEMIGDPVENPKGWQKRQLGTICEVASSKRVFVEELVNEGVPFYRGTEVGQLGESQEVRPSLFISAEHYERLKNEAGVPRQGDLLLPSICPDGRIYLVEDDKPFYFKDGRVLWIKASQGSMNSLFLRHQLKRIFAKSYAQIASGTTFAELKIFALKDAEICTPPLDVQEKFARIALSLNLQMSRSRSSLDELDALFASLQHRAFAGQLS
jgi:type I restriction enzyme, S subunit